MALLRFFFRASSVLARFGPDQEQRDSLYDPQVTDPLREEIFRIGRGSRTRYERQCPEFSARPQPAGLRPFSRLL